ncbi:MAG: CoA-binding protein, partial [Caldimonas sp.]
VVGLSAEWHRPSYFAAKYMQEHGYRIVPVNPRSPAAFDRGTPFR